MYHELFALVSVNHPCVVGFEGLIASFPPGAKAQVGFVFEFCEAGNLFANVFEKQTLRSWSSKLPVLCQVAEGMKHIHAQSLLFRDLNSQNVVLTAAMRAKICDFGSARKVEGASYQPTMIEGSPSTMSPEQLTGERLTLKSDSWQMAVLLWEIMGTRHPWGEYVASNDHTVMLDLVAHRGMRLPSLDRRDIPDRVYRTLDGLIKAGFSTAPDKRPDFARFYEVLTTVLPNAPSAADASPGPTGGGSTTPADNPAAEGGSAPLNGGGKELQRLTSAGAGWNSPSAVTRGGSPSAAAAKSASMSRSSTSLAVGHEVEYYSRTNVRWMRTRILKFNADGTADLDVRQSASLKSIRTLSISTIATASTSADSDGTSAVNAADAGSLGGLSLGPEGGGGEREDGQADSTESATATSSVSPIACSNPTRPATQPRVSRFRERARDESPSPAGPTPLIAPPAAAAAAAAAAEPPTPAGSSSAGLAARLASASSGTLAPSSVVDAARAPTPTQGGGGSSSSTYDHSPRLAHTRAPTPTKEAGVRSSVYDHPPQAVRWERASPSPSVVRGGVVEPAKTVERRISQSEYRRGTGERLGEGGGLVGPPTYVPAGGPPPMQVEPGVRWGGGLAGGRMETSVAHLGYRVDQIVDFPSSPHHGVPHYLRGGGGLLQPLFDQPSSRLGLHADPPLSTMGLHFA